MIWSIALEAQESKVINKSIAFLVNCYLSLGDSLEDRRVAIMQSINTRCFELIAANKDKPLLIRRLVKILEAVIKISEKKGTGGVQPHNAILKGEILDRIIVRYMVKSKSSFYGALTHMRTIVVKLFTSATVWEFKKEVSQILGLAPQYMDLKLPNSELVRTNQHGMTLQELGLKNGDILTAKKLDISEEKVAPISLCDPETKSLIPKAQEIFTEWYEIYKDKATNLMGAPEVAKFIAGATGSSCSAQDDRVKNIISAHDTDKDGAIDL